MQIYTMHADLGVSATWDIIVTITATGSEGHTHCGHHGHHQILECLNLFHNFYFLLLLISCKVVYDHAVDVPPAPSDKGDE